MQRDFPMTLYFEHCRVRAVAFLVVAGLGLVVDDAPAAEMASSEPLEHLSTCPGAPAGYLKIPGTDVCLRIAGVIYTQESAARGRELLITTRYEGAEPAAQYGTVEIGSEFSGLSNYGDITVQTRTNTDWGLLFTTLRLRGTATAGISLNEGYVNVAGLTAGIRPSFFDIGTTGYTETAGLTSDRTTTVIAYTRRLAPELRLTFSLEDGRVRRASEGVWAQYGGQRVPDVVAAIDYDPDWGWIHGAVAAHELRDQRGGSDGEFGWAAVLGAGYRFKYNEQASGRFFLSGAISDGAQDYLGIPNNAPDYIRVQTSGKLARTSGMSGVFSYEHTWSPEFKSAVTASLYRTRTDAGSFEWNSAGFWLTVGSEYIPVPNLRLGLDVTYYHDSVWANGTPQTGLVAADSVVGFAYLRRIY
jgi:hypothetical protein